MLKVKLFGTKEEIENLLKKIEKDEYFIYVKKSEIFQDEKYKNNFAYINLYKKGDLE